MLLRMSIIGCGLLTLLGAACSLSYTEVHDRPSQRHVRVRHVHGPDCGHVWDGHTWVVVRRGHVHGPDCGHHYDGNRWVIRASGSRVRHTGSVHVHGDARGHVHGRDCGHYFDGRTYVRVSRGHVHGPNCGHHFTGSHWEIKKSKARR